MSAQTGTIRHCPRCLGPLGFQATPQLGTAMVTTMAGPSPSPQARAWTRELRARYRRHLASRRQRDRRYVHNLDYDLSRWFDLIGHAPEQATLDDYEAYLALPTGRNGRGGQGGAPAPMTRRNRAVTVLGFYRWAHGAGLLTINPLHDVEPPKVDPGPPRAVPAAQLRQLLDYHADDTRTLGVMWLRYGCGLRSGEVATARVEWTCLDDDEPAIEVLGKFGKRRVVPLPRPVVPVVRALVAGRAQGPLIESLTRPGEHLTDGQVTRLTSRAIKAAGLPAGVTGHWLRHAYAQHLRKRGVRIDVLQRLLGHASIVTTQRYLRGWDGDLHAAAGLLPDPTRPDQHRPRGGRPRDNRPRGRAGQPPPPADDAS